MNQRIVPRQSDGNLHPGVLRRVLRKHGIGMLIGAIAAISGAKIGLAASPEPAPRPCRYESSGPVFKLGGSVVILAK